MAYRAPLEEIRFQLRLLGAGDLPGMDAEAVEAILEGAARLTEQVMEPLQRMGDLHPARLQDGVVRTSPGFRQGFRAIAEGGWIGIAADPEYGGMGLPMVLATAVNEMQSSACLALQLAPLMAQGQIEALEQHGDAALKQMVLPRLNSGEWTATMNLTEPQAGSDVGALRCRAEPKGDGSYAVTGGKIFITWGDHDMAENICHLVLARLPGAAAGTRGISLFLVPKILPDGSANTLKADRLEHKLGLHGSPTAAMDFDGATGWLVGAEGGGMAAMFTMMNNARLGVGVQGLGVAEAALQKALDYARTRVQGRPLQAQSGTIRDHADVRRMLNRMQTLTMAARSICLDCALSIDRGRDDPAWKARAALLTPVAKAFGTETGIEVADLGIQVHGGIGYVEETGAAQLWRDARVTAIYEGTNGIQAMDLVGRKLADGGKAALALLDEIDAPELAQASAQLRDGLAWLLEQRDMNRRFAGAMPFLRALALLLGGHYAIRGARLDPRRAAFTNYYLFHVMNAVPGLILATKRGDADLFDPGLPLPDKTS